MAAKMVTLMLRSGSASETGEAVASWRARDGYSDDEITPFLKEDRASEVAPPTGCGQIETLFDLPLGCLLVSEPAVSGAIAIKTYWSGSLNREPESGHCREFLVQL